MRPAALSRPWIVAVLDTGAAYETVVRDGVRHVAAPSLAQTPIVAPYDFVNDDPYPDDDHQHGTHIATLLVGSGSVHGVAPGAALMPVKVLNAYNEGHEQDLVEGLWHAIANGADVINLSLSFGPRFQPSLELQEALEAAADAGIVVVAAAGNDASGYVSWPAASPWVLAVGAVRPSRGRRGLDVAAYSNRSAGVDLIAPGGDLDADRDEDGLVDGLLAESIPLHNPSTIGGWLMSGTSQAAAVVSGLALHALDAGIAPQDVAAAVKATGGADRHEEGLGAGAVLFPSAWTAPEVLWGGQAAMLPWLHRGPRRLQPRARVTVVDASGQPAPDVRAVADLWGPGGRIVSCVTDRRGQCTLRGPRVRADGEQAWTFALETLVVDGVGHRPRHAITVEDAFGACLTARGEDAGLPLAWRWSRGEHPQLGPVASAITVVDLGAGPRARPLGLVTTAMPKAADRWQVPGVGVFAVWDAYGGDCPQSDALALHGSGSRWVALDEATVPTRSPWERRLAAGGWRIDGYGAASAWLLRLSPGSR